MLLELNLPSPSPELISEVVSESKKQPGNPLHKEFVEKINGCKINIASCSYFSSPNILELAKNEFGSMFDEPFMGMGLMLTNDDLSRHAFYPPHADRERCCALNFLITLGGSNVVTSAYHEYASYQELAGAMHYYDPALKLQAKKCFPNLEWYGLDAVQYHSVENIETVRLMFAISFRTIKLSEFANKYKHLVTNTL